MRDKKDYTGTYPGRDPALVFRFYVHIGDDKELAAQFLECGGLSMERQVKQYEEGGNNDFIHMLPGRIKWGNVTLKHGISRSNTLWKWCLNGAHDGKVNRQPITIVLGDAEFGKVAMWHLDAAYPVKWSTGSFNTKTTDVAVATLELAHHGITWIEQAKDSLMGH